MERLKLNCLAFVAEEIHHHLEIRLARNVAGHHVEVRTIQKDLSEQLERLSFRDVIVREDQCRE